jgi:hypothetical protein
MAAYCEHPIFGDLPPTVACISGRRDNRPRAPPHKNSVRGFSYSNEIFCDIASSISEPESLVLQFMRDIRREIRDIRAEMATNSDLAALRSELESEIRDVALDLAVIRRS